MTDLATQEHYRARPAGLLLRGFLRAMPALFALARRVWPIPSMGGRHVATHYDDVREVFATDAAFAVLYAENLAVITGGEPFFLGMGDEPRYWQQLAAMRAVVLPQDLAELADRAERLAREKVESASKVEGEWREIDVVELIRETTFALLGTYFGIPEPSDGRLDVWACRLFEFQFTGSVDDAGWLAETDAFASALRQHIDDEIARRHQGGNAAPDVLARCLDRQRAGQEGYSDLQIRTAILCMIVGGPPQPPMVVPQAMEQLLRRPDQLALAREAAAQEVVAASEGKGDEADRRLYRIVREALRFDPLAPGMFRTTVMDRTLAAGTARAKRIPADAKVLAAFASAMMDPRRVARPRRFDSERPDSDYMHFGHGLHECFGRHINEATLHRMLKPLLQRPGLRRAKGRRGRLSKRGGFADHLVVTFK